MFHPTTTSLLVAYHDAWLEEMQKEPAPRVSQPARLGIRRRLLTRLSRWLVSAGVRLQARYTIELPPEPEAPVHSRGATAS
jgi:hypothetical protein